MASIRYLNPKGQVTPHKNKAAKRKLGDRKEYKVWIKFRVAGSSKNRKQWFPDLPGVDPLAAAAAYIAKESGQGDKVAHSITWDQTFEDWKILKDPRETTVKDFNLVIKKVKKQFKDRGPWQLTRAEVSAWLQGVAKNTTGRNANKYLANLRAMVKASGQQSGQSPTTWQDLPPFKHTPQERKDIKSVDLKKYIKALDDARVRLPILMLLYTGERNSAICGLTWDDIQADRITVTKKGGKRREILLTPIIKSIIDQAREVWVQHGKPTETVFFNRRGNAWVAWSLDRTVGKMFKKAKLDHRTPHELRHTFATRAHEIGLAPADIAAALGHENINTQEIYTHLNKDQAKKAMDKVGREVFGEIATEFLNFQETPAPEKLFSFKCPACKKQHKIKLSDLKEIK